MLTSRQIFRYAVPARTVTKKALSVLRSKGVSLRTTLQRHAAIRPIIDKHDIIRTEPEVGYITYRNAARGGPILWP